jgi:hypothetical protein
LNLPPESKECVNPVCKHCWYAQTRKGKVPKEALTAAHRYGYRLHSDVSCKMPAATFNGAKGLQRFNLTGDEFTDTLYVDFGQRKSDAKFQIVKLVDRTNNENSPDPVAEF